MAHSEGPCKSETDLYLIFTDLAVSKWFLSATFMYVYALALRAIYVIFHNFS